MEYQGALFQAVCYGTGFLACLLICACVSSPKLRQFTLLIASLALYLTWTPWFFLALLASILVNFLAGLWLRRNPHWIPLTLGICFNLALLAAFKYMPDLAAQFPLGYLHGLARLALPLGISFWTFQALSYLFDQYRGEELDPSLPEFALYMSFFPVTIAGPVCRMPEMLPQFRSAQRTRWPQIIAGLRRIAIGVLMMQLAKLLGQGVLEGDGIVAGFDRATQWTGLDAWCLAFGYGLQLFFDFAGYSHIAIGAAQALGLTIPENFERPFASTNPSTFWTRWHMSLSFWIRDYLFFPLATARREFWWRHLVLIFSMTVFGLWHRASLLFLIWGSYHGVLLVAHRLLQQWQRRRGLELHHRFWTFFSWLITAIFVSLGWIFFRANTPAQARQMLSAILTPQTYATHFLSSSLYVLVALLAAGYGITLWISHAIHNHESAADSSHSPLIAFLARWRWFWIPSLYALALLFVFLVTHGQQANAGQLMYRKF